MAPGVEMSDINWIAILAAMAVNIVLGFIWYGKFTPMGRIWMKHAGIPADFKPSGGKMAVSMIIMVITTFLLMFVLQHSFLAYRDAYRLDGARTGSAGLELMDGVTGAIFTWLGFFVPVQIGAVIWDGKPWSLFLVQTSYYLITLLIAGVIYTSMI